MRTQVRPRPPRQAEAGHSPMGADDGMNADGWWLCAPATAIALASTPRLITAPAERHTTRMLLLLTRVTLCQHISARTSQLSHRMSS